MIEELIIGSADEDVFLKCLKTWKDGVHPKKKAWLRKMSGNVKIFLAKNDEGQTVGMIQIIPIEYSNCLGSNMLFIQCLFVNFYDKGVGNQHKKGYGKALVTRAVEYARSQGVDAIAAWGTEYNGLETSSWYKTQGFIPSEALDYTELVYLPFKENVIPPGFVKRKPVPLTDGKVTLSIFNNGWCNSNNILSGIARKAALDYPQVTVNEYDTFDRNIFLQRGIMEGIFVENEQIIYYGEPFEQKVKKAIENHLMNLNKTGK